MLYVHSLHEPILAANTIQVGWVLPFLWAGVWTALTIPWVQRELKKEYEEWTTANFKA
jgi:hypothetical protein